MTIIPMKSIRTLVKRIHGTRGFIFINANGTISDLVNITVPTDAQPYGDWYVVNPAHREDMLAADELDITEHCVTARLGERLVVIAEPDKAFAHTPRTLNPKDTCITIREHEGHNGAALKVLKSATARAGSLDADQHDLDGMRVQGQITDKYNPAVEGDGPEYSVTAVTSDRYKAVLAALTAEPADVTTVVPGYLLAATASRADWTMTITDHATAITYEKLGVTVTAPNQTRGKYPHLTPLFQPTGPSVTSVTMRPAALLEALAELPPRADPVVLTSAGTVYAEGSGEVSADGAQVVSAEGSPVLGVDPKYLRGLLKAVGVKWPEVTLTWRDGKARASVAYGRGIVGLVQPRLAHFVPARPVDVEGAA